MQPCARTHTHTQHAQLEDEPEDEPVEEEESPEYDSEDDTRPKRGELMCECERVRVRVRVCIGGEMHAQEQVSTCVGLCHAFGQLRMRRIAGLPLPLIPGAVHRVNNARLGYR
jgi:hypothetical protein